MAAPPPGHANLSESNRQLLDAWREEFDQTWKDGRLAACVADLPPSGDPLRLPALEEMVKVDLKRQWQQGRRLQLESYLKTYPELGTPATVSVELILAECEARQQIGEPVTPTQYSLRFPRQADQLVQRLKSSTQSAAGHTPTRLDGIAEPEGQTTPLEASTLASMGPLPEHFGRYRILKKLGWGGMGTVYLAEDTQLHRRVALKVPHFAEDVNSEVMARFQREARAAAMVVHPNICPLHDVGQVGAMHYFTMAYLEGEPLSEWIQSGKPISPKQAAEIVRKLAGALEEAHRLGIIHRDLKPGNIMMSQRGEPIIMDFGLARMMDAQDPRLTRTGAVLGSPAYMAPEQLKGDPNSIGPWTDVYGLGAILYEVLAGRVPFVGSGAGVLAQLLLEEPAPPSTYRAGVDRALEAICLKAMAKKAADRYPTMVAFAAALDGYLRKTAGPGPAPAAVPVAETVQSPAPPRPVVEGLSTVRSGKTSVTHVQQSWMSSGRGQARGRRRQPRRGWWLLVALLALLLFAGNIYVFNPFGIVDRLKSRLRSIFVAQPDRDEGADRSWPEAEEALKSKDYDRAIALLDEVLHSNPEQSAAYAARGQAFLGKREYNRAIADCTDAIGRNPRAAEAYLSRGLAFYCLRAYDPAIDDYTEALRLDTGITALARARLADAYLGKREYEQARVECKESIRLGPELAWGYLARASLDLNQHDYDKALADCARALQLDARNTTAFLHRSLAHLGRHELDQARADIEAALHLDAASARAYTLRGRLNAEQGNTVAALDDYSKALTLDPSYLAAYEGRIKVNRSKPDRQKALADCDAALAVLDPAYVGDYVERGWLRRMKGDPDGALSDFNEAIRLNPRDANARLNRALLYQERKEPDLAAEDFARALESNPRYVDVYLERGRINLQSRSYDQAIQDFDKILEIDPRNDAAFAQRARAHLGKRNQLEALDDFNKAIDLNSRAASYRYSRAEIYFDRQDYLPAIGDFTAVLQIEPKNTRALERRGLAYLREEIYDLAIADYNEIVRIANPQEAPNLLATAYNNRGVCYANQGELQNAIEDYTVAIDLNPKLALYYRNRAGCYQRLRELEKASADREKATEIEKGVRAPMGIAKP